MLIFLNKAKSFFYCILNLLFLIYDTKTGNLTPISYPNNITLSLSNICNASCPICSINVYKSKGMKQVVNQISLFQIKGFHTLFKQALTINLGGFMGESIINPEFCDIIRYLKYNYVCKLFVSTNGIGLTDNIQDAILEVGFDSINFSIHAATPETYKKLQANRFEEVLNNLKKIQDKKNKMHQKNPIISVVYALNKENILETKKMIDILQNFKINNFTIYHYHDYGYEKTNSISLSDEPEYANKIIDDIYEYAKMRKADFILPYNPPYFHNNALQSQTAQISNNEIKCYLPWTGLQFRSSYSNKNCLYLGCCNVFNVFSFNYDSHIKTYGEVDINKIWHHPVFQYLRATVNSKSGNKRNPLCEYCKSKKRDYLKGTNNAENYKIKLSVLNDFFNDFFLKNNYNPNYEIEGLKLLINEDEELRNVGEAS